MSMLAEIVTFQPIAEWSNGDAYGNWLVIWRLRCCDAALAVLGFGWVGGSEQISAVGGYLF